MFDKIMKKLGYISITHADLQIKAAEKEATKKAISFTPFEAIHLFSKDCRKFNFKVVSTEPNDDKATQNAEDLAIHIAERINIKTESAEVKHFARMVVPLIKVVKDKSLLR